MIGGVAGCSLTQAETAAAAGVAWMTVETEPSLVTFTSEKYRNGLTEHNT
jgi:hypothetical protein